MSKPIPSYLFHIPHMGEMINYEQLEQTMKARHPPEIIHVIDSSSKKRLGAINPRIALLKYK